ncbi:MAG: hypothetical protein AAGI38_24435 [Bacteroidota bacterium]
MISRLGLRREDLSKTGEKRTALVPDLVRIITQNGVPVIVQPSEHPGTGEVKRAFTDEAYQTAGAEINEDLDSAPVIFGLKEVDLDQILPDKVYLFFSHTHKGQVKNRPLLRKLMEQRVTLIDYELIANEQGRIITAFTYFAGYAGMIDSLWTLSERWKLQGVQGNVFQDITQAITTEDLEKCKEQIRAAGERIKTEGTPESQPPLITVFLGNGKTSTGAQSIYDLLPVQEITLSELADTYQNGSRNQVYKLVMEVQDMYRLKEEAKPQFGHLAGNELAQLYYTEPQHFESNLDRVFPYATKWMNCIIWSPEYPRLISRKQAAEWYASHQTLQVIGDITCDPEGAIQFSQETWIDQPVFVYAPADNTSTIGMEGTGIAVMAVTNLPCEFSADASEQFSQDFAQLLPGLVTANYKADTVEASGFPPTLRDATILWKGKLTEKYGYMGEFID